MPALRPSFSRALLLLAPLAFVAPLVTPTVARADAATPAAPAPSAAPVAAPSGVAVLAIGAAAPIAWPLAQTVYANPALRPIALDDARARVLAGEAPGESAPPELRDLAEMRAAVKGDDAPSRAVLTSIARAANVRAVVVVETNEDETPLARVFVADVGAFDAARFHPDQGPSLAWNGAAASLARTIGMTPRVAAPAVAVAPVKAKAAGDGDERRVSHPFYASPWFWGAIGAAAFGVGAVYFATRDNDPQTIHLQMQVPK